ncbi:MAG: serine hydrolase [Candidatus Pacebacteria bacterium]|nr:serine hydrolase [Candidatus Paceibacterota bacterium]
MFSVFFSKFLIFLLANLFWLPSLAVNLESNFSEAELGAFVGQTTFSSSALVENFLSQIQKPEIVSSRYAVLEPKAKLFLTEENSQEAQPIASITKLMTALVVLDFSPDWEKVYQIRREDRREGGRIYLFLGDRVKIEDLFSLSLVGSANTATAALVNSLGVSEKEFVDLMNLKAKSLGLKNTNFADPVGLSPQNISTAREVAVLAKEALSQEKIIKSLEMSSIVFTTEQGQSREVDSTDLLLEEDFSDNLEFKGGKTGYLPEAGYCFVAKFNHLEQGEIIVSVLGSKTVLSRFSDALTLANFSYNIK